MSKRFARSRDRIYGNSLTLGCKCARECGCVSVPLTGIGYRIPFIVTHIFPRPKNKQTFKFGTAAGNCLQLLCRTLFWSCSVLRRTSNGCRYSNKFRRSCISFFEPWSWAIAKTRLLFAFAKVLFVSFWIFSLWTVEQKSDKNLFFLKMRSGFFETFRKVPAHYCLPLKTFAQPWKNHENLAHLQVLLFWPWYSTTRKWQSCLQTCFENLWAIKIFGLARERVNLSRGAATLSRHGSKRKIDNLSKISHEKTNVRA